MTTTYTGNPANSTKDAVRFLCQDTDMTPGLVRLQDEEIEWVLTLQSNIFLAAAQCAEEIALYWSKVQNTRIGPLNIQRGQAPVFYQQLADRLKRTASRWSNSGPVFYPVNEEQYQNTNGGRGGPQHIFKIGMDDFPGYSQFWPPADLPYLYTYP
jgi:hypothetical protein